jgi:hypothetical protein
VTLGNSLIEWSMLIGLLYFRRTRKIMLTLITVALAAFVISRIVTSLPKAAVHAACYQPIRDV